MRPSRRARTRVRSGGPPPGSGGAPARSLLRQEGGFTLLETLVAAVVLVVGLMTLFGLLDTSLKATAATRAREGATNLARQILEDARTIPYARLAPSAIQTELQEMHGLADASSASGWQVVQRGVTYTITVSECSIDDPKDGYGAHESAFKENPFCSDSTVPSGTTLTDSQPEDLKRIAVDVRWPAAGRNPDVHQVETLTAAGAAPGLSASGLRLEKGQYVGKETEPVVKSSTATLKFEVSAPSSTSAMKWSVEGVVQPSAPVQKSGTTTWTFSWSMPLALVSDGTYHISAQAVDATGVVGPPVILPVTLLRGAPAAVSGLKGGFNEVYVKGNKKQQVVELEWKANTERNVIGYRVYDPSGELVCPESAATLSLSLSCIDFKTSSLLSSSLTFTAYALYREYSAEGLPAGIGQGAPGTITIKNTAEAPSPPEELKAEELSSGSVRLTWKAPKTTKQAVSFYRIYRGSTEYTSRYGVSESLEFIDTDATTKHLYWVTAVGSGLAESEPLGPVEL